MTNYKAKGSLESPKQATCTSIDNLTNDQNPADIFTGLKRCIEQKNYKQAAELYLTGLSYGFFDTKRVSDKTAHQAIAVIRMNTFSSMSQEILNNLKAEVKIIFSNNLLLCESLKRLGHPQYHPTYMVKHGMGAFLGNKTKNGLVQNFEPTVTWEDTLIKKIKCK
ncbi:hypothetical protein [Thalassotalea sp. ND16A]|uniref:hypothetical protein n=1 Tax=Thalassotalea sp. ND16A TaxID=1535422 RepID=UPI00051D5F45|nr:hypothetical protein [Thalassotalea sp. ND16A]KGK01518.1 hypothetical protein ND16A_2992 [Thalassotalea sp. ND16A]